MSEKLPESSTSGLMTANAWITYLYKQNKDYGMQMTKIVHLRWKGQKGYTVVRYVITRAKDYSANLLSFVVVYIFFVLVLFWYFN